MCGIVAATSYRDVSLDLFDMLRMLDYRGYDSAGISIVNTKGQFEFHKKQGNLDQLAVELETKPLIGCAGVGHTRWATHGAPSDSNAHPHFSKTRRVAVVHNGIIENYRELYVELSKATIRSISETDSEVIAHLIEYFLEGRPEATAREIVAYLADQIKGTYALAIQIQDRPDQIIGMRYQCPLNFVQIDGFCAISSDISSLIKYTNRVGVLIDGEAVVMRPGSVEVFGFDGSKREPRYVAVDWSVQQASKLGHPHYLRKEIEEEPQAIHGLIKSVRSVETDIRRFIRSRKVNKVVFLACGSASFSGAFASILARRWRLPLDVMSDIGSEFRYLPTHMDRQSLLVAVSQSGETADTLGALDHAEAAGAGIMSFVNVVGSSLERRCDCSVRLAAGPEIAVPSTKAVMNQFLAATLVICLLRENSKQSVDLWQMQSERIADCIGRIISMESEWRQTASQLARHQHCFALGRGLDYPIALETGLKFKETAYIHGEAMYAGEFKHGSISLIEPEMPVVCFLGDRVTRQKTISNIEEIKARGAQPFLIAPGDGESLAYLGVEHRLPELDEPWASIMQLAAAHLMCYHAGVLRNVTVDRPRNLAKSVTVE